MKTPLLKVCLVSLIACFFIFSKAQAQVTFTALPGNAPVVLVQGATNQVVFGFVVNVPALATFNPGPVHLAITNNLNGFVTGSLVRTSSNDPNLAISTPLNTYAVAENGTLDINSFPSLGGGVFGANYYFYLVLSITNTPNPQPASVVFSLPSAASISQNGFFFGININNLSAAATQTYYFTTTPPAVTTNAATGVTTTTATIGGTVTAAGTPAATDYGVVVATSNTSPTIADTKLSKGSTPTIGTAYTQALTGLTPGLTYYYRAYVTNSGGTSYGLPLTFSSLPVAPTSVTSNTKCGAGSVTLTAAGAPAGGSYKWYTVSSGGTAIAGATGASYTPDVVTTTTYYASTVTSAGVESTGRTSGTATIYPIVSSPFPNAYLSYSFNTTAPSSTNTIDVSGGQNDGILQAAPTLTTDRFGAANSAYLFNGTSQWMESSKLITNPQVFTISAWINTTTTNGGKIVGFTIQQNGGGNHDRHVYMDNSGFINFGVYSGATNVIKTTTAYNDGKWHHIVATLSSAGTKLFVDDILQAFNTSYTAAETNDGFWGIGGNNISGWPSNPTSSYFAGKIDDVAIYSTDLSASVTSLNDLNQIGAYAPVCPGNPLTIYAPTITGATYTWTDPNGVVVTGQNGVFPAAVAGAYSLTVTGGPGGCSSTATYTPTLYALPVAAFTAPAAVNINTDATITISPSSVVTGNTYSWSFDGGTPTPVSTTTSGPYTVKWTTYGVKNITLTVTNANGCSATSTQTITVALNNTNGNYAFSQPITLNTANASRTTPLTGFPALVYIKEDALKTGVNCANNIQFPTGGTNGYDFAFTLLGGTNELFYQVENYDPTTGTLLAWVQLPTVTAANTSLTFYFGSKTPAHTTAFTNSTWLSDYLSVYHFNELPTTGSATVLESTGNTLTGTPTSVTQSQDEIHSITGNIGGNGGGYTLNGTTSKIVTSKKADILNSFTLSAWVNSTNPSGDNKVVTNQLDFKAGYKLSIKGGQIETETRNTNFAGTFGNLGIGGTVSASAWHYVQGTFDATTGNFTNYLDGTVQTTTTSTSTSSTNNTPLAGSFVSMGIDHGDGVGGINDGSFFKGSIDEIRVSNVIKSADWINLEYINQTTPKAFTTSNTAITAYPTIAAAIGGSITYTWTGATSTDPAVATNWTSAASGNPSFAPPFDGFCSLLIKTGKPNYPVLTAAVGKDVYGLTLEVGSTINLNGYNLNVGCNIYNSAGGKILYGSQPFATDPTTANASTITWNGTGYMAAQSYTGSTTPATAQVGKMIVNNTGTSGAVTIGSGTLDIYSVLKITAGNLAITSPAVLTLKSVATQTAYIDVIPSSYTITGNINAERFVTGGVIARRAYRLLSAPVNQGVITGTIKGYGFTDLQKTTPITGYSAAGTAYNSVTPPANGFDLSLLGNPTVFFYNEADIDPINQQFINSDYKGIASIGQKLPVGNGFLFFFRGDRSVNSAVNGANKTSTTSVPENTTLNWTGVPNQGTIAVSIPATSSVAADASGHKVYTTPATAAGFSTSLGYTNVASSLNNGMHLVGNPYASAIDLEAININAPGTPFIYMLNNSNTFGVYQRGLATPPTTLNNGVGRYVTSGQGFFVVGNSSGTTTVGFTEAAKVNPIPAATAPTTFMTINKPTVLAMANKGAMDLAISPSSIINATPVQTAAPAVINITLLRDSDNMNETVVQFGDKSTPGSNKFNQAEDAIYRSGISQTTFMASYTADNKPCIINTMGALDTIKSVPLYVEGNVDGLYKLSFKGAKTIDSRYILYLVDHFMKDSLDLSANDTYNFTLQRGNAQSFGATRFELVKHKSGVQYNLLGFNGAKKTGSVVLNWKTEHEGTYTMFALQRSTDGGKTFTTIDSLASDGSGNYTMTDVKPANGANQYRLVQTVGLDPSTLSKIVVIGYQPPGNDNLIANFDLYPNPSVDIIKLRLNNITQGKLSIKIYNVDGRVVSNSKANAGGTISQDVSKLLHGGYVLEVSNADGSYYATKKFSKL